MGKGSKRRAELEERLATLEGELAARHDFAGGILGHDAGEYHVNVSERTALGIDAVAACVFRLADAISGGEIGEWRGTTRLDPSRLVVAPMATMFRGEWLWQIVAILALYTRCYLLKRGRDSEGLPLSLEPIVPSRISKVGTKILLDGREELDPRDLIPLRRAVWPTLEPEAGSVLRLAREVFAAAWAQSAYTADFWESGGAPVVQIVSDQPLTNDDAESIATRWTARRRENPGGPAVFGKGAQAKPFGVDLAAASDTGADRLLASVARFFGMQPWLINAPSAAGALVYQNTAEAGLDLRRYTLAGYRRPIEDAWSAALPGSYILGRRVKIDLSHLSEPGFLERAQGYAIATGNRPWVKPSEVREAYQLPPDDDIDAPASSPAESASPFAAVGG